MKNILKIFASGLFVFVTLFFANSALAATVTATANPPTIIKGDTSTIFWTSSSATTCSYIATPTGGNGGTPGGNPTSGFLRISKAFAADTRLNGPGELGDDNGGSSEPGFSGSGVVSPDKTTIYTINCANGASTTVTITVNTTAVDLTSALSVSGSSCPNANFYATVTNIGPGTTRGFSNRVSLYGGTGPQTFDFNSGALSTGQSKQYNSSFALEYGTTYTAELCADTEDVVNEFNEGNNCAKKCNFTCTINGGMISGGCGGGNSDGEDPKGGLSDITASLPTFTNAIIGIPVIFSSNITNLGVSSTLRTFPNFFQVATDKNNSTKITDLSSTSMEALAPDTSGVTSKSYIFEKDGKYFVQACADKSDRNSAGAITESNESNNCSGWTEVIVTDPNGPRGTLTGDDCIIKKDESICTTSLTLDVINPINGKATNVTKSVPQTNTVVIPSSSITAFPTTKSGIAISYGGTTFYLNHNGETLVEKRINAQCESGIGWNGTACVLSGSIPTGTLGGDDCEIEKNESTCTTTLQLNINNPVEGAETNITKPVKVEVASGITPALKPGIVVNYPSTKFYLNHHNLTLNPDGKIINASCKYGTFWDNTTSKCIEVGGCSNGATNPPLCTTGGGGECLNGATNPPECTTSDDGKCLNGATNPPLCTTSDDGKCLNGAANPPSCTIFGDFTIDFYASPNKVFKGKSTLLTWNSVNASECHSKGEASFETEGLRSGSATVIPTKTTTYQIECTRSAVSKTAEAKVSVSTIKIKEN